MQTFLPYEDFYRSGSVLHPKHLGNQFYKEGLILLGGGWKHHPASKMWRGYEYHLCHYLLSLHDALASRGKHYWHHVKTIQEIMQDLPRNKQPWWLGDEGFHRSHRSNLLRKDKEKGWNWYRLFGWGEPDDLPYLWPDNETRTFRIIERR